MQIDRCPNRGPYVAALICLLAMCMTIPLCWQTGTKRAAKWDTNRSAAEYAALKAKLNGNFVPIERYSDVESLRPGGDAIDTLDELLFSLANRPGGITGDQPDLFVKLLGPREAPDVDRARRPQGVVWQYVSVVLNGAGRKLVAWDPGARLGALVADCCGSHPVAARRSDPLPNFSLLLTRPNERLATLPPAGSRGSEATAFPTPWCLPAALIERLDVLAEHPYSAAWARRTIGEVQTLTANDRPSASVVAAQLRELQSLTEQALSLANETGDDHLRAELLRAHWGLDRRLKCWSVMRDIVVASVTANRFAARVPWNDSTSNALSGQGTESVDLRSFSRDLEAYEQSRTPRLARKILQQQRLLAESNDAGQRELANQIEQNYRNSNVRLALSGELLQRFVPQQQSELAPVRDRIVGTPVRGRSITSSENTVHLQPDSQRWHVNLESDGTVDSDTVADGGQVKVYSLGTTSFTAQKSIVVERGGVQMGQCTADAHNSSQLVGVRSSFDWVPLISDMIRSRAIDKYCRKRPLAQAEVECKIACRVERQLDDRADQAVSKVQDQMRERVTGPLEAAGVELTPIELSTMSQRVIARLRIAGRNQLGGHTPRPRAPADSLASVQVHESALTNGAVSLGLDGKQFTAPALQEHMRKKFSWSREPKEPMVDADTVFEFAPLDAVQFRVADGRLELILSLREVIQERTPVRNFRVHAFYTPVLHGLEAELVRSGALGIEGRIGTGGRARMHNVFNEVLSEQRKLPMIRLNDPQDQRLAGLMITQLVLEDGWIGLAIGPDYVDRTAERTRMLR